MGSPVPHGGYPMVDDDGKPLRPWFQFFTNLAGSIPQAIATPTAFTGITLTANASSLFQVSNILVGTINIAGTVPSSTSEPVALAGFPNGFIGTFNPGPYSLALSSGQSLVGSLSGGVLSLYIETAGVSSQLNISNLFPTFSITGTILAISNA